MMHLPLADTFTNPYLLLLAGISIGIIGGLFGLSGSFIFTPLLNAFGFPMSFAIGTNLTQQFGRSVLITVKNNVLNGVNWKIGITMGITGMAGIYLGGQAILILDGLGIADLTIRSIYAALLLGMGCYMINELKCQKNNTYYANKFARVKALSEKISGIKIAPMVYIPDSGGNSISLWLLIITGTMIGLISGLLGSSGSFIRLPFLVLILGMPMLTSLCTDILATFLTIGFGASAYAFAGRAEIVAAMLLLAGSGIGSQIGLYANRHVDRPRVNLCLLANVITVCFGVVIMQFGYVTPAAVTMIGSVFVFSTILASLVIAGIIRESRPLEGLPVKKKAV
ncbi:MAG: sulfite exporter TauE/SafE family protein [Firmicutes bacterium]|nr:sulfite exporter TauE/SafE family protein [Bacillota bacterium]